MAEADETASQTTAAEGSREQVVTQVGRTDGRRAPRAISALAAMSAFAIALAACGSTQSAETSAHLPASSATLSAHTSTPSLSSSSAATARATVQVRHPRRSRIDGFVITAKATYYKETKGGKLFQQLGRIARDGILLDALSRGDLAGAQAEADAQLRSPVNHLAHVTRISVIRGSRVLVNATVNSDGVYVVAPGTRVLRSHGRPSWHAPGVASGRDRLRKARAQAYRR
jgi:hypothetical protein